MLEGTQHCFNDRVWVRAVIRCKADDRTQSQSLTITTSDSVCFRSQLNGMQTVLWRSIRMTSSGFLQRRSVLFMILCGLSVFAAVSGKNFYTLATGANQTGMTTATISNTLTTSLSPRQLLINQSFTVLSTTGTNLQCELWNFTFTGNQGQYISGNFTANRPVDFYLVQDTNYQNWLKQGTCGTATDAIVSQQLTMSYNFSAALPNSGRYDIVLVNSSNTSNAGGSITAYLSSIGYTITEVMESTITTTGVTTGVSTGTTQTTQPTSTLSTNIPGFPVESILAGIIIGLIAILILRFRKRP